MSQILHNSTPINGFHTIELNPLDCTTVLVAPVQVITILRIEVQVDASRAINGLVVVDKVTPVRAIEVSNFDPWTNTDVTPNHQPRK
jgi:hypothetical protein